MRLQQETKPNSAQIKLYSADISRSRKVVHAQSFLSVTTTRFATALDRGFDGMLPQILGKVGKPPHW